MAATLVMVQQGRLVFPADVRVRWDWCPAIGCTCTWPGNDWVWNVSRTPSFPASRSFVAELLAVRRLAAAAE
jgi:hypothetical protein